MTVRQVLSLSLILSLSVTDAQSAEQPAVISAKSETGRVVPKNVELDAAGRLNFALVDSVGRHIFAKSVVVVIDKQARRVQPDSEGRFCVPVAKSGVVVVMTDEHTYGCRVWKQGTAPPRSLSSIAFVEGNDAVVKIRGQMFGSALRSTERMYGLAILGLSGVAVWQAFDDAS